MGDPDPAVVPMLAYEDGPACDALARAFGFIERVRMVGPDGRLTHGEMSTGGEGLIMLATPTADYESPKPGPGSPPARFARHLPRSGEESVLVYVENVDAHIEQARAAGATILSEVEPGGPGQRYRVEDLEGHRWMFMERGH
jgi:uncharacterized glyoxalase superfamily protein PhnB